LLLKDTFSQKPMLMHYAKAMMVHGEYLGSLAGKRNILHIGGIYFQGWQTPSSGFRNGAAPTPPIALIPRTKAASG